MPRSRGRAPGPRRRTARARLGPRGTTPRPGAPRHPWLRARGPPATRGDWRSRRSGHDVAVLAVETVWSARRRADGPAAAATGRQRAPPPRCPRAASGRCGPVLADEERQESPRIVRRTSGSVIRAIRGAKAAEAISRLPSTSPRREPLDAVDDRHAVQVAGRRGATRAGTSSATVACTGSCHGTGGVARPVLTAIGKHVKPNRAHVGWYAASQSRRVSQRTAASTVVTMRKRRSPTCARRFRGCPRAPSFP
jgi:hypothetical protein